MYQHTRFNNRNNIFQKVGKIKPECWDVKLSAIVTELNEFN